MHSLEASPELAALLLRGRKYKIPKGQIIQSTENRRVFNLVISGYVKRYLIANDGSYGVQVIYGPGDIFPITLAYSAVFDRKINEGPETYYYEAMTNTDIYTIDESALKEGVEQNPILYKDLFSIAGKRLHSTLHGLENLTLSNSYHRVAHELHYLASKFGEKEPAGVKILVPLTHQDLADILSLTRETVSTAMVELRKKKLIVTGKSIVVPDMEKLETEAHE
ncbi:MAG: Crp/Fnr family transcriptional regulator [Candidatus Saccharimonadales bacterium]